MSGTSPNDAAAQPATAGGESTDGQDDRTVPPSEQTEYAEWVNRCADSVVQGYVEIGDERVAPKSYHDIDVETFDTDLEERIADIRGRRRRADSNADADEESMAVDAGDGSIDWGALWEEFGFDTEDAAGNNFVSHTQLTAALQCTDQPVNGGGDALIDAGVDAGELVERYSDGGTLRGYTFVGGER